MADGARGARLAHEALGRFGQDHMGLAPQLEHRLVEQEVRAGGSRRVADAHVGVAQQQPPAGDGIWAVPVLTPTLKPGTLALTELPDWTTE